MVSQRDLYEKSEALEEIIKEYLENGLFADAIPEALKIPRLVTQTECLLRIYDRIIHKFGTEKALEISKQLNSEIGSIYVKFCYDWDHTENINEKLRLYLSGLERFPYNKIKNQESRVLGFIVSFLVKSHQKSQGQLETGVDHSTAGLCFSTLKESMCHFVSDCISKLVRQKRYAEATELCALHHDFNDSKGFLISQIIKDKNKNLSLETIRAFKYPHPNEMYDWIKEFIEDEYYTGSFWTEPESRINFEIINIECENYFYDFANMCIDYRYLDEAKKICKGLKSLNFKRSLLNRISDLQV